MFTLFASGTIGFWIVSFIFFVVIIAFVENESSFGTTLAVIAFVLYLSLIVKISLWTLLITHPLFILLGVILYVIAGALWSMFKWHRYVTEKVDEYNSSGQFNTFRDAYLKECVDVSRHKRDLMFWLSYWPFSALWALMHEPIQKLYRMIYKQLQNTYVKISEAALSKAKPIK